ARALPRLAALSPEGRRTLDLRRARGVLLARAPASCGAALRPELRARHPPGRPLRRLRRRPRAHPAPGRAQQQRAARHVLDRSGDPARDGWASDARRRRAYACRRAGAALDGKLSARRQSDGQPRFHAAFPSPRLPRRTAAGGRDTCRELTAWVGQHAHDELRPETTGLAYPIRAVRLKEREVSHYYAGFSNQVLWPLCHMFPSRCRIQQSYWTAYRAANERFAAVVQASVTPGDLVWIHDFHLCLVPGLLRAAGVRARLGVFWHIPFPPPTVFGILRWREELLGGLLGADLLGFQTDADVRNFLASVRQYLDVPVVDDPPTVRLPGRDVRVAVLPIGIDYERFRAEA